MTTGRDERTGPDDRTGPGDRTGRVRVLLADDEVLLRAGVRAVLETDPSIRVVAEASDGREAVEQARLHRPDVALLDVRMPVLDGLQATQQIAGLLPATKVVVLTTFGEDAYVESALTGGAAGFLLKASDPRELVTAVHAVARGGAYLSPRIARRVIAHYLDPTRRRSPVAAGRLDQLTDRERDVLALLGAGLSNADIGRRLHLVEGTVKGHVSAILHKLGARNRVQAALVAHEAGIVPPAAATG